MGITIANRKNRCDFGALSSNSLLKHWLVDDNITRHSSARLVVQA